LSMDNIPPIAPKSKMLYRNFYGQICMLMARGAVQLIDEKNEYHRAIIAAVAIREWNKRLRRIEMVFINADACPLYRSHYSQWYPKLIIRRSECYDAIQTWERWEGER
jgi:hypothetical protein